MAERECCPKCGRPTDGLVCDEFCGLHARLNTMTALVRKLLDGPLIRAPQTKDEKAEYRAMLVVLDAQGGGPSRRGCPICGKVDVVVKGLISVHFRSNEETRPCPASFRTCLAGYLMD